MPPQIDYDALAQQHGGTAAPPAMDYDALAAAHGGDASPLPTFRETNAKDANGNAIVRGASQAWDAINTPLVPQIADAAHAIAAHIDAPKLDRSRTAAQIRGFLAGATDATGNVAAGFTSPVGLALTLSGLSGDSAVIRSVPALKSLMSLPAVQALQRAVQATAGVGFTVHGADRALTADNPADALQGVAEMASGTLGAASAMRPRSSVAPVQRLTPQEQASNAFARAENIPLDAATATGSPTALAAQKRVANSMGGEKTATAMIRQQQEGLTQVGADLADAARPGAAASPVTAGEGVTGAFQQKIRDLHQEATAAYDSLRQMEAQRAQTIAQTGGVQAPPGAAKPFTTVPLAVDVSAAKTALKPLYDGLMREKELVGTLQGGKARTLVALDSLMRGPDLASLSDTDAALGNLKSMARTDGMPELRTQGQAGAAEAVKALDNQVRQAAIRGGPAVYKALTDGRAATTEKYAVADALDLFSEQGPVQVFKQLTANKDLGLAKVRAVQNVAPDQLPNVGRAYLEDVLNQATERGRFDHADKLYADWQKLGPDTKNLLFPDGDLRLRLDNFFLLAKRVAENPNPSGTAHTNTVFNWVSQIPMWGIAKMLYTQRGVNALTKMLSMAPTRPTPATLRNAAQTAGWAEVVSAAKAAGVPLGQPAMAQTDAAQQ